MLQQTAPAIADTAPAVNSSNTGIYATAVRRLIVIAAVAWWLGGFTFYAGVAIPMGVEVLGSHMRVGFITERVTNWLNVGGVIAMAILLANMALSRGVGGKWLRRAMLITWVLMACVEVELIVLHPIMDRLIATQPHRMILNEDRFDLLHHFYLISTTCQWALGVVHVWCICLSWTIAERLGRRGQVGGAAPAA
jgi:hypothetical protein